jgi:hypothetical protein
MKNVLVTLCLLFGFSAAADTYFVRDSKLTGVSKEDAATIHELITADIDLLHQTVADSEKDAKYALQPRVMKLGNSFVLTIQKNSNGKSIFSSQMKADRFEELDNVVERVVRSVVQEVPIDKNGTVKDVTENEATKGQRRKDTVNRWYLGMGPAFATSVNSTQVLFNWSIGYFFEIDPEWALKILYDGTSRFGNFNLGANYYFSEGRYTPLVTASLGYGFAVVNSNDVLSSDPIGGFVAGAGFGYQFFRTSKVNLEILAHGEVIAATNHLGTPTQWGVRVGILW